MEGEGAGREIRGKVRGEVHLRGLWAVRVFDGREGGGWAVRGLGVRGRGVGVWWWGMGGVYRKGGEGRGREGSGVA